MNAIKKDFVSVGEKEKRIITQKNKATVLLYRWLIFVSIVLLTLIKINPKTNWYSIIETIAVAFLYNTFITIYTIKKNGRIDKASSLIIYIDIIALSVFSLFSGGINSDVDIFIFFLLGYCGLFKDAAYTIKVGMFCSIIYSVSCIYYAQITSSGFNFIELLIKDLLFILGAYGISRINYEVKKFDELRKKEFKIARTDKLTGLANRHYLDQKLYEEVEYANKYNTTLNVLIFDLDNFKYFNDTYGHISGDKLLVLFSDIIKQCIRKSDIPVRYGGEEFLILIRELDLTVAKSVGNRIRKQLEKQLIYIGEDNNKKKATVSCGIAQYPMHSFNIKEVIEFADRALYYAKESGKNMVVTYDEI